MERKVINQSFRLLCKFVAGRQESASKIATNYIFKTLVNITK